MDRGKGQKSGGGLFSGKGFLPAPDDFGLNETPERTRHDAQGKRHSPAFSADKGAAHAVQNGTARSSQGVGYGSQRSIVSSSLMSASEEQMLSGFSFNPTGRNAIMRDIWGGVFLPLHENYQPRSL